MTTVGNSPKRILFPWKQFLLLSGIATLLALPAVAVREDQVCYGYWYQWPCYNRLACQPGTSIFLTQAVRGFKPTSSDCDVPHSSCRTNPSCCRHNTSSDCAEVYTQEEFTDLARDCWNSRNCSYSVETADNEECGSSYKTESGYSKVEYMCLPTSNIRDVTDSNTMTVNSLVLRYESPDAPGSYVCLVVAADCSSHTANVLLAKSESTSYSGKWSSIRVHTEEWLPCDRWYATYTVTTPFRVWKSVVDNGDDYQAWAVIHSNATDSSTLRVQCKQERSTVSLSRCLSTSTATTRETTSAVPTTQTVDSTTRPDTSAATAFPSSDVTKGTMPKSAGNTGNIAGVVGAVLLVVVVLVAIVFFLKRRRMPAARSPQEEDNKAYSTLSDLTRSQARTEADYASLGQSSSVNRGEEMAELGADNSAYSNMSDLTPEQPGFHDNCETPNQTAKSEKKPSAPENKTYVNL